MRDKKNKCLLISDFTIDMLAGYLDNIKDQSPTQSRVAPFNQVQQILIDHKHTCWEENYDYLIIWTKPETISNGFQELLKYKNADVSGILAEVDHFCRQIINVSDKVKGIFLASWVIPSYMRGYGLLDMKANFGVSNILMRMNIQASEKLKNHSNIYILNSQKWIEMSNESYTPKLWYMGKIPYHKSVFKE